MGAGEQGYEAPRGHPRKRLKEKNLTPLRDTGRQFIRQLWGDVMRCHHQTSLPRTFPPEGLRVLAGHG
jgi:hypothetical protein